ncbi:hypothetical protein [Mariprofundus ferrooxydans]|uniref:hypothetical protein n=1 Tax=Mariprofundus ferrooxydans TaxID=314344 RepID=UPI000362A597|nr:hypothetical protein [Mariprofundus ferrooxydans]
MYARQKASSDNFYEIFSDMAMLMLAAFVFLFAVILISSRLHGGGSSDTGSSISSMKQKLEAVQQANEQLGKESMEGMAHLQKQLQAMAQENARLKQQQDRVVEAQSERILEAAGLGHGKGKKDFDVFVAGLKKLPGSELHLIVDATGSMHAATSFLVPVLRVIALRSGKHLSALSWYADNKVGTFQSSMNDMFDHLMQDAPFIGADETIGHAFTEIAKNSPVPSAYLLIGDEPPTDTVHYHEIPAPVFTLPLGVDNDSSLLLAFKQLAEKTGGHTLLLKFQ